jgi:Spy/CpxP family protein refolding chaperone
MKRLILACGLVGAIATAHAHPEHGGKPRFDAQQRATYLQKTLQLSDDQAAQVRKILDGSEQQRTVLMDKYKPQLDAFHADSSALREKTHAQINGVLTPKQQEAFKAQAERREGAMQHHRHGRGTPVPDDAPSDERPD